MTKFRHTLPFVALIFSTTPNLVSAATIDADICVSMTVLNQSIPGVIDAGGDVCASISGVAIATNPGDTIIFDDFYENTLALGGGTNTTGSTVNYTVQFDWTYNIITTVLGDNETSSALVRADIFGLEFTTGSGSGSQIMNYSIENNYADDFFITVYAEGYASSIAPVPLPVSIWLFSSGILGLLGLARHNRFKGS